MTTRKPGAGEVPPLVPGIAEPREASESPGGPPSGSSKAPGRPLGDRVRIGILWNAVAMGGHQLVTLAVQLVLARLLVPEAFGLVGMAVVFTGLVQVVSELGISSALVQRREADLEPEHLDTAFWVAMIASTAAVLVAATILGPIAAWFFGEPILWGVVAVISLSLIVRGASSVHRALLTRSLRFRHVALVDVASVVIGGGVAVLLALAGFGVWSIAWLGVITGAAAVPLSWWVVRWRPRYRLSRKAFKDIFGFGAFVTAYDIVLYVAKHADYLLIGKFVGASALGAYTLAFVLTSMFRKSIMQIMTRVMYPVYGKLQDSPERAKRYYLKAIRVNTLLAFPVLALLAVFPHEVVAVVFGEPWAAAAFPLQMLSLAMMIHTAGGTSGSVMRGLGHVRLQFRIYLTRVVFGSLPLLSIGVWLGGMEGVAVAMVGAKLIGRMVWQHYMKRLIGVTELDIVRTIAPAAMGAAVVVGGGLALQAIVGGPTTLPGLALAGTLLLLPCALIAYVSLRDEVATIRAMMAERAAT